MPAPFLQSPALASARGEPIMKHLLLVLLDCCWSLQGAEAWPCLASDLTAYTPEVPWPKPALLGCICGSLYFTSKKLWSRPA